MSDDELARDKQILDIVSKTNYSQLELRERLDQKLNNFVTMTATVATLSLGIALFIFERISTTNMFYMPLIVTFFLYLGFFISAMVMGSLGYKPTKYAWYPEDSERLISDYKSLTEEQIIRKIAASLAYVANVNKKVNARKSQICKRVSLMAILGILTLIPFGLLLVLALKAQLPN